MRLGVMDRGVIVPRLLNCFLSARLFVLLAALLLLPGAPGARAQAAATDLQILEIASKTGVHAFQVEMAVNEEQRAKGLMFRKELPDGRGMLFDFQRDQEISMWMKNTLIPLDMIFITRDGRIHRIAENTEPHSLRPISSGGPVLAVLEVSGGTARKLGLARGDRVTHPMFGRR